MDPFISRIPQMGFDGFVKKYKLTPQIVCIMVWLRLENGGDKCYLRMWLVALDPS